MEHAVSWMTRATVWSAFGLTVDLLGALLIAFDLWRPHKVKLPQCPSAEVLLIQMIDACEAPETTRIDELERCRATVSSCEKDRAALLEQGNVSGRYLRRTGRLGLLLICLGFVGQLAGAILSGAFDPDLSKPPCCDEIPKTSSTPRESCYRIGGFGGAHTPEASSCTFVR